MKTNGKIVSYQENKKFGFIKDKKNQSYFFHISSLSKDFKSRSNEIKIGLEVTFDPKAEPKGMAAREIEIVKLYEGLVLSDFKNYRDRSVKESCVIDSKVFRTRFYKSPKDAKDHLEKMALASGANIIFNAKIEKETWQNGNYHYTMHQCVGFVGLHTRTVNFKVPEDVDSNLSVISDKTSQFNEKSIKVIEDEEEAIRSQKATTSGFGFLIFLAIGFIFFLSMMG